MKVDWTPIKLPYPIEGTHTAGYSIRYDKEKGFSLRLGDIEVVPWKHDYDAMLNALHSLLEMQKSGINLWLNPRSNNICTNKS